MTETIIDQQTLSTPSTLSYKITATGIAIAGSVDSGKSSLVGVLTTGILDDGNGSARKGVAKYQHEIDAGKTSAISTRAFHVSDTEAITLIDLCGHEGYFKTTTFGASGHFPDYAFLIVSARAGVLPMTQQHLRLLLSLNIPIIIIVTHIDSTPDHIYKNACDSIKAIFKSLSGKGSIAKVEFVNDISHQNVNDISQDEINLTEIKQKAVSTLLKSISDITDGKQTIYPVVSISNKTGFFIDVVKSVLQQIRPRHFWVPGTTEAVAQNKFVNLFRAALEKHNAKNILQPYKQMDKTGPNACGVFYIDSCYNPPGIGLVVAGINRNKSVKSGDTMLIGPFGKVFHEIRIKSMHNNIKQVVPALEDHHRGCVAIASKKVEIKREFIKKGTILLSSPELKKNVCYRFKAVISLFTQSLTLKNGYSPMIHSYTIRQAARMIIDPAENNGNDVICFDGKNTTIAVVTFKFKSHPEFIEPYNMFILRSGKIQGIGMVISTLSFENDVDAAPDQYKAKRLEKAKMHHKK